MTGTVKRLFGGGGGGGGMSQAMALAQTLQQQAQMRDVQGRQLAELAAQQGEADREAAGMRRPGLGRALLTYRKATASAPLGAN